MSKKRAYIRKRRSVHLRCRQKAENARKVRSRQKPVQSPESASVTFQAAATLWHRTNVARYKGATAVKYENLLRSHILPELGARQLEEINTLLLADFMNAKLHCGRLDHSGGLSSSYVRSMMLLVLDIMEFAAAEGLCPPVKTTLQTPAANRREVVILDTDALRRLETYLLAKPDITGTGILISLHTGLRISEVCALRWEGYRLSEGRSSCPLHRGPCQGNRWRNRHQTHHRHPENQVVPTGYPPVPTTDGGAPAPV